MSSIIFGPFRLLGNAHLFNWLFWWSVGVDMWCRPYRPEVRIRRRVHAKIRRISNLLKTFEVRTLSNSQANFVTSLDERMQLICIHQVSSGRPRFPQTEFQLQQLETQQTRTLRFSAHFCITTHTHIYANYKEFCKSYIYTIKE